MHRSWRARICWVSFCSLWFMVAACGGSTTAATAGGGSDAGGGSSSSSSSSSGGTDTPTPSADAVGLFASFSSSSSDTINAGGQAITIEEGTSYIYRYLPDSAAADRFDNTLDAYNSFSCDSAGDQRSYTSEQSLYNLEVCPDIEDGESIVDIEKINASTGAIADAGCSLTIAGTSPLSIALTIINDTLYYRNSSGQFVTQALSGCSSANESILLASGETENTGATDFYGINGSLVSVLDDTTNDQYVIKSRSSTTGAITATLHSFDYDAASDVDYRFYEGDDALYWYIYNRTTQSFRVFRYPLSGTPQEIYSATLGDNMIDTAIDASGGNVLIAYEYVAARNSSDVATAWTVVGVLYNAGAGTSSTLTLTDYMETYMQLLTFE